MKHREEEIIALLLGDGMPSPSTRRWLGTAEGQRELAAYRRTLGALDLLAQLRDREGTRQTGDTGDFMSRPARSIYYAAMNTPIGIVLVARSDAGLVRVSFRQKESSFVAELERRLGAQVLRSRRELAPAITQLEQYFSGRSRKFNIPVDLADLTPFQRRVLGATSRIPSGQVVSYGDIARRVGRPRGSRAVGQALGRNPVPIVIPCHRVVASDGGLGGYTGGLGVKRKLLALEGLEIN